jgi:KTSC domain
MKVPPLLFQAAALFCFGLTLWRAESHAQYEGAIISRIPRRPVESRALAAVRNGSRRHAVEIEFLTGAIYRYLDAPKKLCRRLMATESKARFPDHDVRGRFRSVHVRPWRDWKHKQ